MSAQPPAFQPTRVRGMPERPGGESSAVEEELAASHVTAAGASGGRKGPPLPVLAGGGVASVVAVVVAVLLLAGGSSNNGKANPHCDKRFAGWIKDGFPEPPTLTSRDGSLSTTLSAALYTIHDNHHTWEGMEYDGSSPGPTLVICPGDTVRVQLQNKLPIPTNLHVHGLHMSPEGESDNVFIALNPLQEHHYKYQLPLDQSPGTFWYHPHFHPLVDAETTAGMLGAIVVEGGLDERLASIPQRLIVIHGGKPFPPGGKPLPIPGVKPGQIKAPPAPGPAELLVNGVFQPTLHIRPGELQRWRVINGTGERYVKLALPGTTFELLAIDGNTLREMRPEREILIGPGERVEVLVRGATAGGYQLDSIPFQPCYKGCFDPFGGVPMTGRNFGFQTLVHVVSTGSPDGGEALPSGPLADPPDLRKAHVDVERKIVLSRIPSFVHAPQFPVNNRLFDPNRTDITMALNSVEQWTITSPNTKLADEWHNFHIHTNPFQVVAINGKPLDYVDWQDTVNVPANGSVTIRIHPIDFVGTAVFHCHIDFHEDNGMMGVFRIVKDPSPAEVNAAKVVYMSPPDNNPRTYKAQLARTTINTAGSGLQSLLWWCRHGVVT